MTRFQRAVDPLKFRRSVIMERLLAAEAGVSQMTERLKQQKAVVQQVGTIIVCLLAGKQWKPFAGCVTLRHIARLMSERATHGLVHAYTHAQLKQEVSELDESIEDSQNVAQASSYSQDTLTP